MLTATPGDPWRRTVRRTPRPRPRWDPVPIPLPSATSSSLRPGAIGLVTAGTTMVASIGIAVFMGSPMFLLFGAVGVLASLGMWVAGRIGAARDGRRAGVRRQREVAAFVTAVRDQRAARWQHHVATTPSVAEAVAAATTRREDLWARRADHDDAFRVTLGWGLVEWTVAVERSAPSGGQASNLPAELAAVLATAERFEDAAVPVDLGPGAALAVGGRGSRAVTCSLLTQLAAWVGPADWRLVLVVEDPSSWDWCRWLPHASTGGRAQMAAADDGEQVAATLGRLQDGDPRHVVVVTDRPDLLAQRTGPLRRFVGAAPSVAVLVTLGPGESAPAMCRSKLEIGSIGLARWWPDTSLAHQPEPVHAAGVPTATATEVARALAGLHDPEDPAASTNALPPSVGLGALSVRHGVGPIDDAIAIAAAWRSAGDDPAPVAMLGSTADGVVEIDLARDGPHALIAGTTGSGKSELLRTLVASLATRSSPDHLTFVLIDYKGGSTFDACADLPHTVGVVTDLDDRLAERALVSLEAEIRRRERILRAAGAADLAGYRAVAGRPPMPRLVVVIDEFAALAAELPAFLSALVGVAQRGRSLGIHLVLATQRPAGVVSDDIRANTNLRLALRLQDVSDARDVVGDEGPVTFPRGTPGRTMLRLGPGETVVFQSAHSSGPVTVSAADGLRVVDDGDGLTAPGGAGTELTVLVGSIRHAAALSDVEAPHRPWLPPLPTVLEPEVIDRAAPGVGAVGLLDVPAAQCRRPLRWRPADGSLALLGGRGAGTTSALASLVVAACADPSSEAPHVYVIDGRGDDRLDVLETIANCGAVVRPHERERLERLLRRLVAEIDRRRSAGGRSGAPDIIVAVDGMPELRVALDLPADGGSYELLRRVVVEGAALGVVCVMTGDRPGVVPPALLAACAGRWIFHLDDPAEAGVVGVPAAMVPGVVPGRVVVASARLEGQLAVLPVTADLTVSRTGPEPIGVLPEDVAAATLPLGTRSSDGDVELVVGVDFETLGPARIVVPDGEHLLVAGPARSGRSTVLARLVTSWREAHPGAPVHVVCPVRRSTLSARTDVVTLDAALGALGGHPGGRPALLVVDDAERVADPSGALAALVTERRPGTLVIAAVRPDALRSLYGHWTGAVRQSRAGVLMAACSDVDGDVLGQLLPRRPPLAARPGLAWVVGAGRQTLVQIGRDDAAPADGRGAGPGMARLSRR
ncbi:MAG: FtsK/SpoIIIE domain-containing protein [Ilumatobacteraceae bacterium]